MPGGRLRRTTREEDVTDYGSRIIKNKVVLLNLATM
jgi:hypothetical protein